MGIHPDPLFVNALLCPALLCPGNVIMRRQLNWRSWRNKSPFSGYLEMPMFATHGASNGLKPRFSPVLDIWAGVDLAHTKEHEKGRKKVFLCLLKWGDEDFFSSSITKVLQAWNNGPLKAFLPSSMTQIVNYETRRSIVYASQTTINVVSFFFCLS